MKQHDPSHAVLLPQTVPGEVLSFLDGYIFEINDSNYLLCSDIAVQGHFVELVILKNDYSGKIWKVRLPVQYALAMVDMSDKEALPIGFRRQTSQQSSQPDQS